MTQLISAIERIGTLVIKVSGMAKDALDHKNAA